VTEDIKARKARILDLMCDYKCASKNEKGELWEQIKDEIEAFIGTNPRFSVREVYDYLYNTEFKSYYKAVRSREAPKT